MASLPASVKKSACWLSYRHHVEQSSRVPVNILTISWSAEFVVERTQPQRPTDGSERNGVLDDKSRAAHGDAAFFNPDPHHQHRIAIQADDIRQLLDVRNIFFMNSQ